MDWQRALIVVNNSDTLDSDKLDINVVTILHLHFIRNAPRFVK